MVSISRRTVKLRLANRPRAGRKGIIKARMTSRSIKLKFEARLCCKSPLKIRQLKTIDLSRKHPVKTNSKTKWNVRLMS